MVTGERPANITGGPPWRGRVEVNSMARLQSAISSKQLNPGLITGRQFSIDYGFPKLIEYRDQTQRTH